MRFSTGLEYAIHALVYLACMPADRPRLASEVAAAIDVPEAYLRKILQQLVRGGILSSLRGVRGGVRLARDPSQITLRHVVEAVEGSLPAYDCLRLRRGCSLGTDCPVRLQFERARRAMGAVLDETSMGDLATELAGRRDGARWLRLKV